MCEAHLATGLSVTQESMVPIAAFAATGSLARLSGTLELALDAGLAVSQAQEVLLQVSAYAGFPRSLNALSELMKVLDARAQRGITDNPGRAPSKANPNGHALLEAGTSNQLALVGVPLDDALFEFAPAAGELLRTHLFGDIFERDNLDWQSRKVAAIAMLAVLSGTDSQLCSHLQMALNAGLTPVQLHLISQVLEERVGSEPARRVLAALALELPTPH